MNKSAFKAALLSESERVESLIVSIQRKIVETDPDKDWVGSFVLEHRLYASMGMREGVLKAIEILEKNDV